MLAGYASASWLTDPARGHRNTLMAGVRLLILFTGLRILNQYGDPFPWSIQNGGTIATALSFINLTKYPASLQFLCLMIGLALVWMGLFYTSKAKPLTWLAVFGRVPFFFYVLHIPLISLGAFVWMHVSFGEFVNLGFSSPENWPEAYTPSLGRTYLVWVLCILVLYLPCRWFAAYRRQNAVLMPWLAYL
jgi:hypothetical protein